MQVLSNIEGHPMQPMTAREYMAREWPGALRVMVDPSAREAFAEDEAKVSPAVGN